jgi:hypothetical protein
MSKAIINHPFSIAVLVYQRIIQEENSEASLICCVPRALARATKETLRRNPSSLERRVGRSCNMEIRGCLDHQTW